VIYQHQLRRWKIKCTSQSQRLKSATLVVEILGKKNSFQRLLFRVTLSIKGSAKRPRQPLGFQSCHGVQVKYPDTQEDPFVGWTDAGILSSSK
jgi:hypothetical protein